MALPTGAPAPRSRVNTVTETPWALQPSAYLRLVYDAGWQLEPCEAWLTDLPKRMFLD